MTSSTEHEGLQSHTAAILIIGNEITTGRTQDQNAQFLTQELDRLGIATHEIRMIPDDEDMIVRSINTLRQYHTYVFTTGGIGPTHDDITAASIAKAFNVPLERHHEIEKIIETRKKNYPVVKATYRMADIPKNAKLIGNPLTQIPGFNIENVYVLAGVPSIMRGMFDALKDNLHHDTITHSKTIDCNLPESHLADGLATIQNHFQAIKIGSYPYQQEERWRVNIVLRAKDEQLLEKAHQEVITLIESLGGEALPL